MGLAFTFVNAEGGLGLDPKDSTAQTVQVSAPTVRTCPAGAFGGKRWDGVPMLISHLHRFIYTKTIKTAGTSVEIYFENACLPPRRNVTREHYDEETVTWAGVIGYRGLDSSGRTWYNHMRAREIRALVGNRVWTGYYKFCVVRNPFDKMVSLWWHRISGQNRRYAQADFTAMKTDFSRWCVGYAHDAIDRGTYMIDGQVSVDFFIRYESLLDDLESVCSHVEYPFEPERLGHYKNEFRLARQPFVDYYDQAAIAAVEAAFGWEMDYFGYDRLSGSTASN